MDNQDNKKSWFARLKDGLHRSSSKLSEGIGSIFTKRKLDEHTLAELEDLLISSDLGPATSARLVADFARNRFGKDITDIEVKQELAKQISLMLSPYAKPLSIDRSKKPFVILVVGVNGTGKTTTIGKLAQYYQTQGLKVMLAAGDTFRAAAISQLKIWGDRTHSTVISGEQGSDAAALAYHALEKASTENADILLVDTAGRLHNKDDLMQELSKLVRVIKKLDNSAPHSTLLVLDATTGQNAHSQVEVFSKMTEVTGLVVTKLDGTAKGGVIVALADKFKLPIHAIGVGEGVNDFKDFDAHDYAQLLMGMEDPLVH